MPHRNLSVSRLTLFEQLFEQMPDPVLVTDLQGLIIHANAQVEESFGYGRAELVGKRVETLIPQRFRALHDGHRHAYSMSPHRRRMGLGLDLHGCRKDGTEFPVDVMLNPVQVGEHKLVLCVVRDVTGMKEAEEALRRSEQEKRYLAEELTTTHRFNRLIGESPALKRILQQVETVAPTDASVLILGEPGTGKELIARAIHDLSTRHNHAFVKLNCSAIPTGLLESELFGHEKGAFTSAIAQKIGRLELAHQGTFFLDEIGDLPLELQPKILRALQEKEFERLGSTRTIPVNVRLIAATNRDLTKMVAEGHFRSDLYYRLKVFPITLPPLRERREDIPVLASHFVAQHSKTMNRKIDAIPKDVLSALSSWHWPGNVRELENFMERSVILTHGSVLRAPLGELQKVDGREVALDANFANAEREHILRVLRDSRGHIGGANGAAERLGLKRTTLNSKMKKLGIQRGDYI